MSNQIIMKDKEKNEIKVGDLVKKCGYVTYADGPRYKVSRKTWQVSKIEDDRLFYRESVVDWRGETLEQDVPIPKAEEIEFLVVGDSKGFKKGFAPDKVLKIDAGSVAEKYRVLKDVKDKDWKKGDIVNIVGKVSFETLEGGWLEKVDKDTPHKHNLIVVDSARVGLAVNNK